MMTMYYLLCQQKVESLYLCQLGQTISSVVK